MNTAFMRDSLEDALRHCHRLGLHHLELGTGGYLPKNHCDPEQLLASPRALASFRALLEKYEVSISALSIHGEPLHPSPAIADQYDREYRATCRLAKELGVTKLTLLAGLPGATAEDASPNWVLCQWPPRNFEFVEWQWSERLIPYWREHIQFAEAAGTQLCFEIHAGDLVYHPSALLRLRAELGPIVGATLDPAHLVWQGMSVHDVILRLGDVIYHVHAKDNRLNPTVIRQEGILDPKPMDRERERSWLFRTVGYGSDAAWWRDFISTLRMVGYDSVLSIEHEDPLIDPIEGLERSVEFLRAIVPVRPRSGMWFVDEMESR
jgi:sugar phosphate isomerase/epimerase